MAVDSPADDPFTMLGLPARFDLSPGEVQSAYLARAAALHPDRALDPMAQADATGESARLNQARATLADDEQRANALLALLGGRAKEQDKSLPPGFLTEIMDVRQQMEEAMASGDAAKRAEMGAWAANQRMQYVDRLGATFGEFTHAEPARKAAILTEARMHLNAWRYIERMIEQLDPA